MHYAKCEILLLCYVFILSIHVYIHIDIHIIYMYVLAGLQRHRAVASTIVTNFSRKIGLPPPGQLQDLYIRP